MPEIQIGWFYEDFQIGATYESSRRTITEADIVLFAGLSSDYNPLHTDEIFAQDTEYKGRIAHGMLILSIMTGLIVRLNLLDGTTKAFQHIEWRFMRAVRAGDSIYARMSIDEKKEINREDAGLVTFKVSLFNQDKKAVGRGKLTLLMAKKKTTK
ncbi:MAG: hypothetical protein A2161_20615 [Candidatus Schekmanbacteria bacterium RBG_13_48_7]|uniref:MaoC-like domain-containing protein n=1 Tax=Candidatus Schekmanbacteria bacterium RBG_13_48_7 TaxID=1817878 RepID=A0A1F7S398_9BACT|nr:MAG: hypothetical protein A2161_20615 [Candidatus Schekmanbacteria bacterium RBG_13_48_7]